MPSDDPREQGGKASPPRQRPPEKVTTPSPPTVDGVAIDISQPGVVRLKGTIAGKEAIARLTPYFKSVHSGAASRGAEEICVDVAEVTFANAASIRLFIDWAVWAKGDEKRLYVLRFRVSRNVAWQKTAFSALKTLMPDTVVLENV